MGPPIMLGRVTAGRRSTSLLLALGTLASLLITAGIATRVDALNGIGSLAALAYVLVLLLVLAREVVDDRPRLDAAWREATNGAEPTHRRGLGASFAVRILTVVVLVAFAAALAVVVLNDGWWLLAFSLVPAVGVLIAWRTRLTPRAWIAGSTIAAAISRGASATRTMRVSVHGARSSSCTVVAARRP